MMSSNMTILNIAVIQLMRLWIEKIGMIGYLSRDPGLVSNQITNIYKMITWIWIITNV